ncbi:hypothetical protein Tco_0209482 [Tanacetum coccineum]
MEVKGSVLTPCKVRGPFLPLVELEAASLPFVEILKFQLIITDGLNHGKPEEKNEPDPDDGILEDEKLQRIQDPVIDCL